MIQSECLIFMKTSANGAAGSSVTMLQSIFCLLNSYCFGRKQDMMRLLQCKVWGAANRVGKFQNSA